MAPVGHVPLLLIPVVLFFALALTLLLALRRSSSPWVLRLAALFVALWALLATTALVTLLSIGRSPGLFSVVSTSSQVLAPVHWQLWLGGAIGAFALLVLAFLLNQAVGRGFLELYAAGPYPWPRMLPRPAGRITVRVMRSPRPDAFSFTLLEFGTLRRPFVRNDVILLSEGLLATLDEEEVVSVLAHELGHIRDLDSRYLTFFRTFSRMMRWDPVLAYLADAITRHEEYRADWEAVQMTRRPRLLAQALYRVLAAGGEGGSTSASALLGGSGRRGRRETLRRIDRLLELADSPEYREDRRG